MKFTLRLWKGGAGSGHRGHAGRPGQVGGSVPEGADVYIAPGAKNQKNAGQLQEGLALIPPQDAGLVSRIEFDFDKVAKAKIRAGVESEVAATGAMHSKGVITFATFAPKRLLHEYGHAAQGRLNRSQWSALDNYYTQQSKIYRKRVKSGKGIPGNLNRSWKAGLVSPDALRGISNPALYKGEKGLREFHAESYRIHRQYGWRMEAQFPGLYTLMQEIHGPSNKD